MTGLQARRRDGEATKGAPSSEVLLSEGLGGGRHRRLLARRATAPGQPKGRGGAWGMVWFGDAGEEGIRDDGDGFTPQRGKKDALDRGWSLLVTQRPDQREHSRPTLGMGKACRVARIRKRGWRRRQHIKILDRGPWGQGTGPGAVRGGGDGVPDVLGQEVREQTDDLDRVHLLGGPPTNLPRYRMDRRRTEGDCGHSWGTRAAGPSRRPYANGVRGRGPCDGLSRVTVIPSGTKRRSGSVPCGA